MADYFSEFSSIVGAKGLPSPADTPYETPGFLRSKRSSRAVDSSREHSISPPLPPDTSEAPEQSRDGRYSALDPRRFTPTLHASLVSEILNLRRELDSKNNLVENLETSLSSARSENESLSEELASRSKEMRKANQQVRQMEKGALDAVEQLVQERDKMKTTVDEAKDRLEALQKKTRLQDEDALRTQSIWEGEKESWDNERRQLERRVHVTESRLRAVVDEMAAQHAHPAQTDELGDESLFKDSGLGDGSDTASIRSTIVDSPTKHRRNVSTGSLRLRNARNSLSSPRTTAATPDLYGRAGNTLADELDIFEEDENNLDEFDHMADDALTPERVQRKSSLISDAAAKARQSVSLTSQALQGVAGSRSTRSDAEINTRNYQDRATTPPANPLPEPASRAVYVDNGYQPSPPASPPRIRVIADEHEFPSVESPSAHPAPPSDLDAASAQQQAPPSLSSSIQDSPLSPPQTPVVDGVAWLDDKQPPAASSKYVTASTQTELAEQKSLRVHAPNRDSLAPPMFVPAIAIHPPSSRPSSPLPYVLPPGTKNASAQADLPWPRKDAMMQTEEIRIDRRSVKLPAHLLPSSLLPSPAFQEFSRNSLASKADALKASRIPPRISIPVSPPLQSPTDFGPDTARSGSAKDLRSYPLKAIPLPRPVLSPPPTQGDTFHSNGPLNRSAQYGVGQARPDGSYVSDLDDWSEGSDHEDLDGTSAPASSRPPPGRFNLSEPPKAVPEDKEISPERRPQTADSHLTTRALSVSSSSRVNAQPKHTRQMPKIGKADGRRDYRSRSPSFGSLASSSYSAPAHVALPPYPIPMRSSSRVISKTHSEGSRSPTLFDEFGARKSRQGRSQHSRQASLRKVQSATAIRSKSGKGSPQKHRRRRQSPDLTPVQSMLTDSPAPTKFPIPELPTPLQDNPTGDYNINGSVDTMKSPGYAESTPRVSEETNLVDAIAGTMVGEWMWKYMRKRKSFGIGEDSSEFLVADQSGMVNMTTAHGTRHKRWVWLSPYERTIMWDTKQPNSGAALLGKKGRKLAIQSVLDVEDLTPLTKGAELSSAWKRSILVLTPERALKFTTTTAERHALWMTALSFLSQSAQLPTSIPRPPTKSSIPPVPPIPPLPSTSIDGVSVRRNRSPSFGKAVVRDSIRLAKGKRAEFLDKVPSQADQPSFASDFANATNDPYLGGADFPAVPRLYSGTSRHQRKRSNTSPRLNQPPAQNHHHAIRNSSSSAAPSSASSALRQNPSYESSFPSVSTLNHGGSNSSRRESLAAGGHHHSHSHQNQHHHRPNFFEAVGTVRMEAFVDPNIRDGVLYVPAPPPNQIHSAHFSSVPAAAAAAAAPPHYKSHRRGSNLSQSTVDKRRAGYVFDDDGIDPFKGF